MTDQDREVFDSIAAALWSLVEQLEIANGLKCPDCGEGYDVEEPPVPKPGGDGESN